MRATGRSPLLSKWPIRNKLLLGIGLLLVIVATLSGSAYYGLYAYRGLVKGLSARSTELPLATALSQQVSNLRVTLSQVRGIRTVPVAMQAPTPFDRFELRDRFRIDFEDFQTTLARYRDQLKINVRRGDPRISDDQKERETLGQIDATLARIVEVNSDQAWLLDELKLSELTEEVEKLHQLAPELHSHLHERFHALARDVRVQYRTAIVLTWVTSITALLMVGLFVRLFYQWIFRPLRVLIDGSRQVASGRFDYRIRLTTNDEMSELAEAMNDMTTRFQTIRDDLDRQVQQRTKEVVRSEQLASVGFLAAGVAHEINNPLASIALCSESLESRVSELLDRNGNEGDEDDRKVIRDYLRMIQEESFRCKQITEQLLDFSRMGDVPRQATDLRELIEGVIDMVRHLGRYQDKEIELADGPPVFARVNAQEMKQVAVNLITNGLDSIEGSGTVSVEVYRQGEQAQLIVADDGCGMTVEVLKHLFEPFFTRRRGGQGTGLGLSITYRIIADHDGQIEATSGGVGQGSRFVVSLPSAQSQSEPPGNSTNRYRAA